MKDTIHKMIAECRFIDFHDYINKKNMDWRNEKGFTPLHVAVEKGYDDFANVLIDMGADLDAQTYAEKDTAFTSCSPDRPVLYPQKTDCNGRGRADTKS